MFNTYGLLWISMSCCHGMSWPNGRKRGVYTISETCFHTESAPRGRLIRIITADLPMSCFGHGLRSGVYPPRLIPSQYNLLRNRWENDGTWMNMMLSQWIGLNCNNSVAEIRSTWGYEGDSHFQPLFQWRQSEVMIKFIRHYRCFAH